MGRKWVGAQEFSGVRKFSLTTPPPPLIVNVKSLMSTQSKQNHGPKYLEVFHFCCFWPHSYFPWLSRILSVLQYLFNSLWYWNLRMDSNCHLQLSIRGGSGPMVIHNCLSIEI